MPEITFDDLDRLTRELESMTRAGIPMPEGLKQLESTLKPGRLKTLAGDLAAATEKGIPLSQALSESPFGVPPAFVALVRCAEVSGDMRSVLGFAVDHARRIKRHRSSVLTTLIYPAFVVVILIGTIFFLANSIFPRIEVILARLRIDYPWPTRLAIWIASLFTGETGGVVAVVLIVAVLCLLFVRPAREWTLDVIGRLPGFNSLVGLSDTALFTHSLGRMLGHNVPLPFALEAASLAVWGKDVRAMLGAMSRAAEQGNKVGVFLRGKVPSLAAYLFQQGEERGELAETCVGIADYCEDRFERLSKRAIAFLEPAVLLVVAIGIAVVLAGVYLPLFLIPKALSRVM